MTETYTVRYEITPAAMTEAIRLHQAVFVTRYRIVMVAMAIAGVVVALAVDTSLGLTIAIFAVLLLAMTWMQFADRWLFANRARGVVGGRASTSLTIEESIIRTRLGRARLHGPPSPRSV